MAEVSIQKVETRYRLPHSQRAQQRRLDQLAPQVIEAACAESLERLGLPEDSELCLRNIFVPVSLRLNSTDRSLVDHWSSALALEIVSALRTASTRRAVVYQSRRQALIDMAQSVAREDLRRCWAWRQLGLWKANGRVTSAQATVEVIRALCSEAELIVPALSALALSGELQTLARSFTEQQWQTLAVAAITIRGEGKTTRFLTETSASSAVASVVFAEARRVIERSDLLRSLLGSLWLHDAGEVLRRAVAVLIVLEVQPMLLQRESAPLIVGLIADAISKGEAVATELVLSDDIEATITATKLTEPELRAGEIIAEDPLVNDLAALKEASPRAAETTERSDNQGEEVPPLDLRQHVFSRWAGLLFLLGVLEDLNLPDAILDHHVLGKRDFSWALHQLALALTGTNAADPAALAFAGLRPDAKPPSDTEEPPTPDEAAALLPLVEVIAERLRVLLEAEAEMNVVEFVCRRHAQLVADPGWIEVRFSLDDLSTEIRRAGLDLNPGYISWLGIVVSFVYE